MSFNSIGQNGVEEFFETILYSTAYPEAQKQIQGYTKDVSNEVIQEALSSMMAIMSSGLIFLILRKQEAFISGVFDVAKGIVIILIGSEFGRSISGRLSRLKGIKLVQKVMGLRSAFSDRVAVAKLVTDHLGNHIQADISAQNETQILNSVNQTKEHIVNKEKLTHAVGNSMASRYNDTLLFKLFTKSFTPADEAVMKKILGRDTASKIDIADMNKIADFMFVTDSSGNVTGLSEQMFQLVNGLGYTNK